MIAPVRYDKRATVDKEVVYRVSALEVYFSRYDAAISANRKPEQCLLIESH